MENNIYMSSRIERPVRRFGKQIGTDGKPQNAVKSRCAYCTDQRSGNQTQEPTIIPIQKKDKAPDHTDRHHHIQTARNRPQGNHKRRPEQNKITFVIFLLRHNGVKGCQCRQIAERHERITPALHRKLIDHIHTRKNKRGNKRNLFRKIFPGDTVQKNKTAQTA